MDNLTEYLKIKSMSSSEEIGDYIATSVNNSSSDNFIIDLLRYYLILRTIAKEQDKMLWEDYERIKAKMQLQKQEKENKVDVQPVAYRLKLTLGSKEAKIIPLFPRT